MNIEEEFHDLKKVVEGAGKLARKYFDSDVNPCMQKEDGSLVTVIDKKIETILRTHIKERFPDDAIVGEEYGADAGSNEYVWFIDPIDGTDNFIRKIPFFCVTAARLGPGPEDSMSIIHNPASGQTFASLMENGTYENEKLCNLTADPIGSKYKITVATMKLEPWMGAARYNFYKPMAQKFGSTGHYSSGLLEFAYVAAGRLDGFFAMGYTPWDTAAGLYLVKAAGGAVSVFTGGSWRRHEEAIKDLYGPQCLDPVIVFVSHPDIHNEVLDFIGDPKQWADKE